MPDPKQIFSSEIVQARLMRINWFEWNGNPDVFIIHSTEEVSDVSSTELVEETEAELTKRLVKRYYEREKQKDELRLLEEKANLEKSLLIDHSTSTRGFNGDIDDYSTKNESNAVMADPVQTPSPFSHHDEDRSRKKSKNNRIQPDFPNDSDDTQSTDSDSSLDDETDSADSGSSDSPANLFSELRVHVDTRHETKLQDRKLKEEHHRLAVERHCRRIAQERLARLDLKRSRETIKKQSTGLIKLFFVPSSLLTHHSIFKRNLDEWISTLCIPKALPQNMMVLDMDTIEIQTESVSNSLNPTDLNLSTSRLLHANLTKPFFGIVVLYGWPYVVYVSPAFLHTKDDIVPYTLNVIPFPNASFPHPPIPQGQLPSMLYQTLPPAHDILLPSQPLTPELNAGTPHLRLASNVVHKYRMFDSQTMSLHSRSSQSTMSQSTFRTRWTDYQRQKATLSFPNYLVRCLSRTHPLLSFLSEEKAQHKQNTTQVSSVQTPPVVPKGKTGAQVNRDALPPSLIETLTRTTHNRIFTDPLNITPSASFFPLPLEKISEQTEEKESESDLDSESDEDINSDDEFLKIQTMLKLEENEMEDTSNMSIQRSSIQLSSILSPSSDTTLPISFHPTVTFSSSPKSIFRTKTKQIQSTSELTPQSTRQGKRKDALLRTPTTNSPKTIKSATLAPSSTPNSLASTPTTPFQNHLPSYSSVFRCHDHTQPKPLRFNVMLPAPKLNPRFSFFVVDNLLLIGSSFSTVSSSSFSTTAPPPHDSPSSESPSTGLTHIFTTVDIRTHATEPPPPQPPPFSSADHNTSPTWLFPYLALEVNDDQKENEQTDRSTRRSKRKAAIRFTSPAVRSSTLRTASLPSSFVLLPPSSIFDTATNQLFKITSHPLSFVEYFTRPLPTFASLLKLQPTQTPHTTRSRQSRHQLQQVMSEKRMYSPFSSVRLPSRSPQSRPSRARQPQTTPTPSIFRLSSFSTNSKSQLPPHELQITRGESPSRCSTPPFRASSEEPHPTALSPSLEPGSFEQGSSLYQSDPSSAPYNMVGWQMHMSMTSPLGGSRPSSFGQEVDGIQPHFDQIPTILGNASVYEGGEGNEDLGMREATQLNGRSLLHGNDFVFVDFRNSSPHAIQNSSTSDLTSIVQDSTPPPISICPPSPLDPFDAVQFLLNRSEPKPALLALLSRLCLPTRTSSSPHPLLVFRALVPLLIRFVNLTAFLTDRQVTSIIASLANHWIDQEELRKEEELTMMSFGEDEMIYDDTDLSVREQDSVVSERVALMRDESLDYISPSPVEKIETIPIALNPTQEFMSSMEIVPSHLKSVLTRTMKEPIPHVILLQPFDVEKSDVIEFTTQSIICIPVEESHAPPALPPYMDPSTDTDENDDTKTDELDHIRLLLTRETASEIFSGFYSQSAVTMEDLFVLCQNVWIMILKECLGVQRKDEEKSRKEKANEEKNEISSDLSLSQPVSDSSSPIDPVTPLSISPTATHFSLQPLIKSTRTFITQLLSVCFTFGIASPSNESIVTDSKKAADLPNPLLPFTLLLTSLTASSFLFNSQTQINASKEKGMIQHRTPRRGLSRKASLLNTSDSSALKSFSSSYQLTMLIRHGIIFPSEDSAEQLQRIAVEDEEQRETNEMGDGRLDEESTQTQPADTQSTSLLSPQPFTSLFFRPFQSSFCHLPSLASLFFTKVNNAPGAIKTNQKMFNRHLRRLTPFDTSDPSPSSNKIALSHTALSRTSEVFTFLVEAVRLRQLALKEEGNEERKTEARAIHPSAFLLPLFDYATVDGWSVVIERKRRRREQNERRRENKERRMREAKQRQDNGETPVVELSEEEIERRKRNKVIVRTGVLSQPSTPTRGSPVPQNPPTTQSSTLPLPSKLPNKFSAPSNTSTLNQSSLSFAEALVSKSKSQKPRSPSPIGTFQPTEQQLTLINSCRLLIFSLTRILYPYFAWTRLDTDLARLRRMKQMDWLRVVNEMMRSRQIEEIQQKESNVLKIDTPQNLSRSSMTTSHGRSDSAHSQSGFSETGSAKKAAAAETKAPTTLEAIQGLEQQKNNLEASIQVKQRKIEMLGQQALQLQKAGNKAGAIAKIKEKGMLQKAVDGDNNKVMALTGQIIQMEGVKQTSAQFQAQMAAAQAATAEMQKVDLNKVEDAMDNYQDSMDKMQDLNDLMIGQFTQDMMDDDDALAELEELNTMELQHQLDQQQLPSQQYTAPVQQHAPPQAQAKRSEIADLEAAF
ncbi:hypothetical protein BLNAU_8343 [Blattamonas nauphoetae]|uniref:Uncharacterized protein n=1 Tax=Blattamonas nauphoetae TaxID=2049346 RepID=A0ABQ9XZ28_9EUKA|nr:hypothetical protein BLNAU_8343 [Blattamonas nauphoetae]